MDKLEFLNYIKKNIKNLNKTKYFSYCSNSTCIYQNFLSKNGGIVTGLSNIVLDDDSVYSDLFDNINYYIGKTSNKNEIIVKAIQKTVLDYFGVGKPAPEENKTIYLKLQYDKDLDTSIKDFKGKRWASCMERSALAFNLFKALNYDCVLISTDVNFCNNVEGHSFLMVKLNGKYFVYDLIASKINDGEMPSPLLCEIEPNVGQKIMSGIIPKDINLYNVRFNTQSGKQHSISYHFYKNYQQNKENSENFSTKN